MNINPANCMLFHCPQLFINP